MRSKPLKRPWTYFSLGTTSSKLIVNRIFVVLLNIYSGLCLPHKLYYNFNISPRVKYSKLIRYIVIKMCLQIGQIL